MTDKGVGSRLRVVRRGRDRRFSEAYRVLHETLSTILWEEDPSALGSAIGSPMDEYDAYATKLIPDLRDAPGDVPSVLRRWFEERATERLVERVTLAWNEYEAARIEAPSPQA
jgi:hypothetical protein